MNSLPLPRARPARNRTRFFLLLLLAVTCTGWAGEAYWIDVRSAEEYAEDHLAMAVNIPHTEISDRIGEVTEDKAASIYLYCRSGHRAGIAQAALQEAGFTHVTNVGGLEDARAVAARLTECDSPLLADCPAPGH